MCPPFYESHIWLFCSWDRGPLYVQFQAYWEGPNLKKSPPCQWIPEIPLIDKIFITTLEMILNAKGSVKVTTYTESTPRSQCCHTGFQGERLVAQTVRVGQTRYLIKVFDLQEVDFGWDFFPSSWGQVILTWWELLYVNCFMWLPQWNDSLCNQSHFLPPEFPMEPVRGMNKVRNINGVTGGEI